MALYIFESTYTAESLAAQIKNPQDRIEALRKMGEAEGAEVKIVAGGFRFGEHTLVIVAEVPDDTIAASIELAVTATGTFSQYKATPLLSGPEWVESLQKAQASQYQPPRESPSN